MEGKSVRTSKCRLRAIKDVYNWSKLWKYILPVVFMKFKRNFQLRFLRRLPGIIEVKFKVERIEDDCVFGNDFSPMSTERLFSFSCGFYCGHISSIVSKILAVKSRNNKDGLELISNNKKERNY